MLSLRFKFGSELARVYQVAVMRNGNLTNQALAIDRLRIPKHACPGGAVTGVADRHVPRQSLKRFGMEDLAYKTHVFVHPHLFAIAYGNAG
jgi:hypothetical protein